MTKRLLLSLMIVLLALSGCESGRRVKEEAAKEASYAAKVGPPLTAQPSGSPDPTTGCPVTVTTLESAFKANGLVAGNVVLGKGLTEVSCFKGYATAITQPENVNTAVVVFRYDARERVWGAISGGGENVCRDTVPGEVRLRLLHCPLGR